MRNHPNAMWARRQERRGWLTAILGAGAAVHQSGILTPTNAKDAERFGKTQAAYAEAIKGNVDALNYLKFMSGKYGTSDCGAYGACGGWATQTAKDYSAKLYAQAIAVIQGQLPQGVPVPTTPATTTPNPVQVSYVPGAGGGITVQSGAGGGAGGTTFQTGAGAPPTTQQRTQTTLLWVAAGLAALGVLFLVMRKRS